MQMVRTTIKYDGSALAGKSMDVADLAPSLIALSDLIKAANRQFNGDRSGVKILVNANLDQNCFELFIDLAQTLWESVSNLIADDRVATIKEIAEWIGILKPAAGGITLYALIKILRGKTVESTTIEKNDGKDVLQIHIYGDSNHVTVDKNVYEMYSNQVIRNHAIKVLEPLTKDGYDSLEFYDGKKKVYEHFDKSDVPSIDNGNLPEIQPQNVVISKIKTIVRIRKPAYEGNSKWTLVYKRAIEAAIEDKDWLEKFQSNVVSAPPGSALEVDMDEKVVINSKGEQIEEPVYTVTKVHSVAPPAEQIQLI
ncbi:MAG: hypothetical protein FGM23_03100 [Alphaproteobacteria bacterium]|nr:hypothetical protein [Alphaproteobacteria bacterium]